MPVWHPWAIQDGIKNARRPPKQGKLVEILEWKFISLMDYVLCKVDRLSNIMYHNDHIKISKWPPKSKMAAKK